jgi:acyl dehydratase
VRVLALGQRRGPATEAQALFSDLDGDHASFHPLE